MRRAADEEGDVRWREEDAVGEEEHVSDQLGGQCAEETDEPRRR